MTRSIYPLSIIEARSMMPGPNLQHPTITTRARSSKGEAHFSTVGLYRRPCGDSTSRRKLSCERGVGSEIMRVQIATARTQALLTSHVRSFTCPRIARCLRTNLQRHHLLISHKFVAIGVSYVFPEHLWPVTRMILMCFFDLIFRWLSNLIQAFFFARVGLKFPALAVVVATSQPEPHNVVPLPHLRPGKHVLSIPLRRLIVCVQKLPALTRVLPHRLSRSHSPAMAVHTWTSLLLHPCKCYPEMSLFARCTSVTARRDDAWLFAASSRRTSARRTSSLSTARRSART